MSLNSTLRSATLRRRWVTNHARKARTDGLVVLDGAVGVPSARRRRTRVSWLRRRQTTLEGVSGEAGLTLAVLSDFGDQAVRIDATRSWFTEDSFVRLHSGFATLLLGFSGGESGLALTRHGAVRLLDAFRVGSAGIGFAARLFNCYQINVAINTK